VNKLRKPISRRAVPVVLINAFVMIFLFVAAFAAYNYHERKIVESNYAAAIEQMNELEDVNGEQAEKINKLNDDVKALADRVDELAATDKKVKALLK
jgi:cell division protein FtsB